MDNKKIDFVILWVDGNDEAWLKEKNKYLNVKGDSGKNRFRDWDNLQYIFRGIEKHANWVNKIFFITWGHLPSWLNINNPKLRIVKHEEFIPKEYLPTFNSNVIELNLHRIKDLSERFVLFNDDLFILKDLKKEDFFKKDLPTDIYYAYKKKNCSKRHETLRNNYLKIINKHFNKNENDKRIISKIFNYNYGFKNFNSLIHLKDKEYSDFYGTHLTQSYLKSSFSQVWEKEYEMLDKSCYNKFRAESDIGQGIIRYWQLLSGKFSPFKSLGKYFIVKSDNTKLLNTIIKQKYKIICVNDADASIDFEKSKKEINTALKSVFSEKSKFEK
ncbi:MAG: Stealth CR1 domain-containing protein [Clostridia bacterium]|nr:Stealth CR1 domain-containing protein [Clostridia bacterium]MBP3681619.1 Stealth CR1 domain-containing protein [Clostridia bacterium]